ARGANEEPARIAGALETSAVIGTGALHGTSGPAGTRCCASPPASHASPAGRIVIGTVNATAIGVGRLGSWTSTCPSSFPGAKALSGTAGARPGSGRG
ncbi:MAG TPA: hypothetical protein VGH24_12720, partial [Solirubrobacteraceae bacterium]